MTVALPSIFLSFLVLALTIEPWCRKGTESHVCLRLPRRPLAADSMRMEQMMVCHHTRTQTVSTILGQKSDVRDLAVRLGLGVAWF